MYPYAYRDSNSWCKKQHKGNIQAIWVRQRCIYSIQYLSQDKTAIINGPVHAGKNGQREVA